MLWRVSSLRGQGAGAGRARGPLAKSVAEALACAARGEPAIFVRGEMEAEDVPGIRASAGVVLTRGGVTADGAIVARGLGKPCVIGCAPLSDLPSGTLVSIDGATGAIEVE